MGSRMLFNKFTAGELDPKFIAEVDYEGYRKAARKLRNVLAIPQGGATRRFGTIYETAIMNGPTFVTDPDLVRLIAYEHRNDEFYYIIIRPDMGSVVAFDIYLDDVFQTTVLAPANTYTEDMIREIRWVKDYERLILLHNDVPPYALNRLTINTWNIALIQFQYFPVYDFTYEDNPATLPTPNVPYWSAGVTFTPNAMAATTVTASTAVYTSNHVGGLFYGNGGVFRITAVNGGGTVATGFAIDDFTDGSAIRGDQAALLERGWNDGVAIGGAPAGPVRGWPSHGTFYQSRLVLGGSPELPGTAYASVVNKYFDFDDSSSDPSSGWGVEIGVTGNDIIFDILATKSLILISNKGPASTSILLDTPTTPLNAFLNTQGSEGARNMNSVIIDNQVVYADRAGNTIWSMSYEVPDTGYNVSNASILSTQLIRNPRWADIFDPDNIDGRYYLLVNQDGSMAIYNTIAVENIKAWTLAQTTGSFVDVGCTANQAKVLARRKIISAVVDGEIDGGYTVDTTFNAFRDVTVTLNVGSGTTVMVAEGDYLLLGNEIEFTQVAITFGTASAINLALTFEFLNNLGTWEVFTPIVDGTLGFTQNGTITWAQEDLSNWGVNSITQTTLSYNELKSLYWVRIRRTEITSTVGAVIDQLSINTEDRIYMERLSFDVYMDSQTLRTSDMNGQVVGLFSLAGQNAFVFVNGFPDKTRYVQLDGTLTVDTANADITIGLDYTVNITTMPVVALLQNGYSIYEPTHVEDLYVDVYQTLGMTVSGQNVPQVVPGAFMTDEVPVPFTGYYKIPTYGGWDARYEFVITQTYPAPLTLLGVSYTIEVSP